MHQFQHGEINFDDRGIRTFYFISTGIVLLIFWIISSVLYFQNYETGTAFLIFCGVFTCVYVLSSIALYCYYKNEDPILPITDRKSINEVLDEINNIE